MFKLEGAFNGNSLLFSQKSSTRSKSIVYNAGIIKNSTKYRRIVFKYERNAIRKQSRSSRKMILKRNEANAKRKIKVARLSPFT